MGIETLVPWLISSVAAIANIILIFYLKKISKIQADLINNQSAMITDLDKQSQITERLFKMVPIDTLEKIIPYAVSQAVQDVKAAHEKELKELEGAWRTKNDALTNQLNAVVSGSMAQEEKIKQVQNLSKEISEESESLYEKLLNFYTHTVPFSLSEEIFSENLLKNRNPIYDQSKPKDDSDTKPR